MSAVIWYYCLYFLVVIRCANCHIIWLRKMKLHLTADYRSETFFNPVYLFTGQLTAVELATQYVHDNAPVTLPQDLFLPQLDEAQHLRLLQSQIALLEQHQAFFEQHQVMALMRIDEVMAATILASEFLLRKLLLLPFLVLDVSETFPQLAQGKNNPLLNALSQNFRLSLSRFGAGKSPATAVYDNLFTCLRLDKEFIHSIAARASFLPFIQAILDNYKSHADHIFISGIDDLAMLNKVAALPDVYLHGNLFPTVKADALCELVFPPNMLTSPRP